jgi:hypothetical protein
MNHLTANEKNHVDASKPSESIKIVQSVSEPTSVLHSPIDVPLELEQPTTCSSTANHYPGSYQRGDLQSSIATFTTATNYPFYFIAAAASHHHTSFLFTGAPITLSMRTCPPEEALFSEAIAQKVAQTLFFHSTLILRYFLL